MSQAGLASFCSLNRLVAVMMIAELVAVVYVLSGPGLSAIGVASAFVQWIALSWALSLCAARPLLARWAPRTQYLLAWLWMLVLSAAASAAGGWLAHTLGLLAEPGTADGNWRYVLIAALVSAAALRYFHIRTQWEQDVEARAEAQLRALQARIRPHFLFNTLNTIAGMARSHPDEVERAILDLSDLFRAALARPADNATLADELALCRGYLAIERLRLGERLAVEWDLGEVPEDALLPPMTLQPLLENAVHHGAQREGVSLIRVDGARLPEHWEITVSNPLGTHSHRSGEGLGMALRNVAARLRHRFGEAATLNAESDQGRFWVRIRLPQEPAR